MRITELDDEGSDDLCGREIVRVKAKRALVGAGARILFYPTLLYNVFRNKLQAEFRWWDEVDQFLLLGAVPFPKDVPRLRELGVRAVITLNEPYETLVPSSLYKAHGIDHLVIPTRDYLFAPSLVDICCAVDFIHSNSSRGRITYVHCKAGRGRSTTIVLCYLVEYKHMSPAAALEYVRSRRPRVLLAPSQWRAVQEYSKRKLEFPAMDGWMLSSPPAGDEVLITEADLEGYGTSEDHCRALCAPSHRVVQAGPIILRLTLPSPPAGDEVLITAADFAPPSPPSGDEVLITDADLEGYGIEHYICNDNLNASSHRIVRSRPMIAKLSCLFASLKFSGGSFPPVVSRPPEIRAC